jgi:hypothetical protein
VWSACGRSKLGREALTRSLSLSLSLSFARSLSGLGLPLSDQCDSHGPDSTYRGGLLTRQRRVNGGPLMSGRHPPVGDRRSASRFSNRSKAISADSLEFFNRTSGFELLTLTHQCDRAYVTTMGGRARTTRYSRCPAARGGHDTDTAHSAGS